MDTLVQGYLTQPIEFQLSFRSKPMFPADENHHSYRYQISPGELSNSEESGVVSSSEGEIMTEPDHSDAILRFISQMLMEEEDLENKPCMLHDCLALQATEKSLFEALNNTPSPDSNWNPTISNLGGSSFQPIYSNSNSREKKNRHRDDDLIEAETGRSNKQLANDNMATESETFEMYDEVLLCTNLDAEKKKPLPKASNKGRQKGGRKQSGGVVKEFVDLRSLLLQCAQAVASFDIRTVTDLLARVRQHSSPHGDGMERLAHYFANAIDVRLAGTGAAPYPTFPSSRISAADVLKAYKTYITACPFKKMSNLLANKTIRIVSAQSSTLHIIDFGILYGYQWPCLIHALSEHPGGPSKLRITGIDFPQPGFRPAERVEATGRRLANYCKRFGVEFEYIPIAQKWETIKLEDLKIEEGEYVAVNSLYRLHNVPDETVMANSPRDVVLSLIRKINPNIFIHGIVNGTFNTPFFITRFREALFHYSSLFDMFEATVGREDAQRLLFEEQVLGREAMDVIAREGTERLERPETYKQWQVRNLRAGFRQVDLDEEIVQYVRNKVKNEYHKDFSVDEDGKWLLQGWKGRVINALSFWEPNPSGVSGH